MRPCQRRTITQTIQDEKTYALVSVHRIDDCIRVSMVIAYAGNLDCFCSLGTCIKTIDDTNARKAPIIQISISTLSVAVDIDRTLPI